MDNAKLKEAMRKRKAELKPRAKAIKMKPGINRYRILPGWREGDEYTLDVQFGQHFIKDEAGKVLAVFPCEWAIHDKPCPICSALKDAEKATSDPEVMERLEEANAGRRFIVNVLELDGSQPTVPQPLELPGGAYMQVMDAVEAWGDKLLGKEGMVIQINREGTGLNTKYSVTVTPDVVSYTDETLKKLPNLDEFIRETTDADRIRALEAIRVSAGLLAAPTQAPAAPAQKAPELLPPANETPASAVSNLGETADSLTAGNVIDVLDGDGLDLAEFGL